MYNQACQVLNNNTLQVQLAHFPEYVMTLHILCTPPLTIVSNEENTYTEHIQLFAQLQGDIPFSGNELQKNIILY